MGDGVSRTPSQGGLRMARVQRRAERFVDFVRYRAPALAGVAAMYAMLTGFSSSAGSTVSVMRGGSYGSRIFPDNAFTVADASQLTGRRINFREGIDHPNIGGVVQPSCTNADYSICDAFAQLNKLDGFDLQPRVLVPFTGAINLGSVNASDFFISTDKGRFFSGLRQLTFDPATNTLAGISDGFLSENTSYRIHVTNGILDNAGHHVNACGGGCVVRFTTRTATDALVRIRQSMDLPLSNSANAYVLAGFPDASTSTASRKLTFTQNGVDDVFLAASVEPSLAEPFNGIVRTDQVKVDPTAPGAFQSSAVPNLIPSGSAGYYAFGSFLSPRYQFASASGQQDNPYGVGDGFTDGPRSAGRERAALAQTDRRARVGAHPDRRRQHGPGTRPPGRPRHPRSRDQPRRPFEDHVLRAQLRRHLRDDADGHRPALPSGPAQRARRPHRRHRAAVEFPWRPGRQARDLQAELPQRWSWARRLHRGPAASRRSA